MSLLRSKKPQTATEPFRVLYVGTNPRPVEKILTHVDTVVGLRVVTGVAEAMKIARTTPVDCIIVDQRRESNQSALLTAALAGEPNVKQIIVMTSPENSAAYEALGGKCQVLFYPVQPMVLLEAVFVDRKSKGKNWSPSAMLAKLRQTMSDISMPAITMPQLSLSRYMVPVASFIYKNTALVLLAALFSVFISYGALIVFYLTSNNWAAPLTLSIGNQLVTKTQNQISDLQVKRNLVSQRILVENRETEQARRRYKDADVLASYVANTMDREIEQRLILQKDTQNRIARMTAISRDLKKALGKRGAGALLRDRFRKRLINRKVYNSSQLELLSMRQRLASIQSDIAVQKREQAKVASSIVMLESMRQQIQQPEIKKIVAASAEFVPLGDQVISIKTTLNNAKIELASHSEQLALFNKNARIIDQTIAAIAKTPLARAAKEPVVVLFVPYENAGHFDPGEPLYVCRFGIVWCTQVGKTGKPVAGEVVSVHPFFGKNIRGSFVEANLTDPEAAKKEVLYVGRPPLFF